MLITYVEVLFARAEAAARAFSSEDAASLYLQTIRTSLRQYGISETDVNTYTSQPEVQFDAANFGWSIGEQKWIALYGQGLEAGTIMNASKKSSMIP